MSAVLIAALLDMYGTGGDHTTGGVEQDAQEGVDVVEEGVEELEQELHEEGDG